MVFDWLAREGWIVLVWWVLVTLAGAAALPACTRLLGGLPDRGYTLARAVGLLMTGFVFWLLGSLGFLRNTPGNIVLSWLIVGGLSLIIYFRGVDRVDWKSWWRENRGVVITGELLFIGLLLGWSLVRAHLPDLRTTEKPMDLMFLSSIMRSPTFPPNDGWMADYSISYYYFGYFISAMLSKLSNISSTLGYSMTVALVVALTGLGGFGVGYNLIQARQNTVLDSRSVRWKSLSGGLLAMVMIVFMGNFQVPLVEFPYQTRIAPEWYLQLTGTQATTTYPEREVARAAGIPDSEPITLNPGSIDVTQWGIERRGWWWFRASRVLNDYDLTGQVMPNWYAQPIDEFPQFSFLLADNHPHVTALPFVLLALGMSLNLILLGRSPQKGEILFYGFGVGALVFLNTWDGPIYIITLVGADGVRRLIRNQGRLGLSDLFGMAGFGIALVALTVIFYLPFLISFRSQAAGLLPNVITPTFFSHFFIMFGPFLLVLLMYLLKESLHVREWMNWSMGIRTALGVVGILVLVMLSLILVALLFVPEALGLVNQFVAPFGGLSGALPSILGRRLVTLPTTLVLILMLVIVSARLFPRVFHSSEVNDDLSDRTQRMVVNYSPSTGFTLLIIAIGAGLILVPEFFYLRDQFSTRINTVFKFYYQAWIVFSLASSFAIYTLLFDMSARIQRTVFRVTSGVVVAVVILAGLWFPVYGIYDRMFLESGRARSENPAPLSMDGGSQMISSSDYEAITCWMGQLGDRVPVVVEALGGAYNPSFGRVAAISGVPSLLGWENHERQWRGSTYDAAVGTRATDIPNLYTDMRWEEAQAIIQRYDIEYIFFGSSERQQYGSAGEEKFIEYLEPVCSSSSGSSSVFYRVPLAMHSGTQTG